MPLSKHIEKSIKNMLVAQVTRIPNSFAWPHNNGICLVKSASKYLFQTKNVPTEKPLWNWIWKFLYPKKIQFFIWKAMRNWVPTRQYLAFSRPYISDRCPRCNNFETTIHILRDCPWAKEVWCHSLSVLPLTFWVTITIMAADQCNLGCCYLEPATSLEIYFPFLCWHL